MGFGVDGVVASSDEDGASGTAADDEGAVSSVGVGVGAAVRAWLRRSGGIDAGFDDHGTDGLADLAVVVVDTEVFGTLARSRLIQSSICLRVA